MVNSPKFCIFEESITNMLIIDNMVKPIDYLKNRYSIASIRGIKITDEDDDGNKYKKTIRYMENKVLIDFSLTSIIHSERNYVVKVLDYIIRNLVWGTNVIILKGVDIAKETNLDVTDVSKGISRLKELNVIERVRDIPEYKNDDSINKKLYTVNHNLVFKGNIKNLKRDFDNQL